MGESELNAIREAGVVGAGGAGFPTHIKVNSKADVVIANGAECEPLLRVDRQVMERYPDKVVNGLKIVMKISGSNRGVICLKGKYHRAVEKLKEAVREEKNIGIRLMGSFYPAGDEQQIVYEVTGKVVPPGGIPLDVGAVVLNVSTLVNISNAVVLGEPVTHRFVTVTGEVENPVTLNAPIGAPFNKLIEIAGGPREGNGYSLIVGGPAMGRLENNWEATVTKTTGGIIVLPSTHRVVLKKASSLDRDYRLAKSVCCQCNYCTQMCPRNMLGLGVEPHKAMRAIGYGSAEALGNPDNVFSCCDCGLCSLYACNMDLSPGRIMTVIKSAMLKKGIKPKKDIPYPVNSRRDYQKVPTHRFIERLGLAQYDREAPMKEDEVAVEAVRILLKQHIGVPATPTIKPGDFVRKGEPVARVEDGKVGANLHASISGRVTGISDQYIEIGANGKWGN